MELYFYHQELTEESINSIIIPFLDTRSKYSISISSSPTTNYPTTIYPLHLNIIINPLPNRLRRRLSDQSKSAIILSPHKNIQKISPSPAPQSKNPSQSPTYQDHTPSSYARSYIPLVRPGKTESGSTS
jgi:hypothetical protein